MKLEIGEMAVIKSLLLRLLFILIISSLLTILEITFIDSTANPVFTVLGIVFSVAMSIVTGFNLNEIVWKEKRQLAERTLRITRDELLYEFILAIVFIVTHQINYTIVFKSINILSMQTFSSVGLIVTLLYMIDKFRSIHNLNDELSEKIVSEKTRTNK